MPTADHAARRPPSAGRPLLWALIREHRRGLLAGAAVGLAWSAGKVAVPRLTSTAIDRSLLGDDTPAMWAGLIVCAAVLAGLFAGWRRWIAFRESRLAEAELRERLVDRLLRLDASFHDRMRTGDLLSRASSDLLQVQGFVVMIPLTISQLAMVVSVVAILLMTEPLLALVALAPLPVVNVLAQRFSRAIHPAVLAVQSQQARLAGVVEESVAGVRVVKGFGGERVQMATAALAADDIRRDSLDAARIRSAFLPALELLPNLGLVAVLAIGGARVLDGTMSYGGMIEFMQYIALLVVPLRSIGMTVAFAQRAVVALGRLDEVLRAEPAVAEPLRPQTLPAAVAAGSAAVTTPAVGPLHVEGRRGVGVEFDSVTFGYPDATEAVIDGLDLRVEAGETVAIVGATGSGKSTLARLLLRWYDVQSGSIRLDGVDVRDIALHDLRRTVGAVFDDTVLFDDTIAANLSFGRPDATRDRIETAARLSGAHEFVCDLPDGYDTRVGQRGYSLSGGQRQRIAIARALVVDPRVLVLDDATSAVDPSKEDEIRSALAAAASRRTTIVIAHRPGTIALASRVVFVDGGRVAASGAHAELLRDVPRYREVLAAFDEGGR